MKLQRFVLGELAVNSYLLWEENSSEAICVDPGEPVDEIIEKINKENLKLESIILTHGHGDHIMGVEAVKLKTKAPVVIHSADSQMLGNPHLNMSALFGREVMFKPDRLLSDGDIICLGSIMLTIRHTPGHTSGGICIFGPGLVITGDTLFAGSIGRTDLPGGDQSTILYSIKSLLTLPDFTRVFPGHGPETNIGRERVMNPFLKEVGND